MTAAGYFAHPTAVVESADVGEGTRIWAFVHVLNGARIGQGCNIGDHCYIESGVVIGNEVTIKNGVAVWAGVTIEDRVFLGPGVSLTNDLYPRSRAKDWTLMPTRICQGSTVGANATILCGITIGEWALVGAGAVVMADIPAFALVLGNPAKLAGFVCRCARKLSFVGETGRCPRCGRQYIKTKGSVTELPPNASRRKRGSS